MSENNQQNPQEEREEQRVPPQPPYQPPYGAQPPYANQTLHRIPPMAQPPYQPYGEFHRRNRQKRMRRPIRRRSSYSTFYPTLASSGW